MSTETQQVGATSNATWTHYTHLFQLLSAARVVEVGNGDTVIAHQHLGRHLRREGEHRLISRLSGINESHNLLLANINVSNNQCRSVGVVNRRDLSKKDWETRNQQSY